MPVKFVVAASLAISAAAFAPVTKAGVPHHYQLSSVASFEHQVTGVAVTPDQRIFVNFPRWTEDAPISVGELQKDGSVKPYPSSEWNAWRNAKPLSPADHFVCVQAVFADTRGSLWVVDPAAPNTEKIIVGGPKVVRIDLATNQVAQVFPMGLDVAPQGSYLNDLRITPDGRWGLLTDSGKGALIVLDLKTGQARRLLDGDKSTQSEQGLVLKTDGKPLVRPDGRAPDFAADGLAIDPKGEYVYWQALRGTTLYRLAISAATDSSLEPSALAAKVEAVQPTHPADGLWFAEDGLLYSTDFTNSAVRVRVPGQTPTIAVQDARLRWPDSFAEGPDGSIYVTTSHIQDSSWFHVHGSVRKQPYGLWRVTHQN